MHPQNIILRAIDKFSYILQILFFDFQVGLALYSVKIIDHYVSYIHLV